MKFPRVERKHECVIYDNKVLPDLMQMLDEVSSILGIAYFPSRMHWSDLTKNAR